MENTIFKINGITSMILKNTTNVYDTEFASSFPNKKVLKKIISFIKKICYEVNSCYKDISEWVNNNYIDLIEGGPVNKQGESINERPFLIYLDVENDFDIIGMCLMKRTENDQKIALLYVDDKYGRKGFASDMLNKSHIILDLPTTNPYIYVNENIFQKYPFFPHVIVKCGYQYDKTKDVDGSNMFYFTMDKALSRMLRKYNNSIISKSNDMTFGVIK